MLLRDALRTTLVVTAVAAVGWPLFPRRPEPVPAVEPYPLQYVATCCGRPLELRSPR